MQKRALFLHKQVKSFPIFPLHIHKSRTIYVAKSAFRDMNLPQRSQVRWLSDFCWIAIRLTPKWPSDFPPIAIHLLSDGHRTGVNTPLSFSLFRKALVFGALLACRISAFLKHLFIVILVPQWFTSFKRIKNRVFPSRISLTQEYAILACGIYSLTKCQRSGRRTTKTIVVLLQIRTFAHCKDTAAVSANDNK